PTTSLYPLSLLDALPIFFQFFNFPRDNDAAPAAENFNLTGSFFLQKVVHIFKKLDMTALIGRNSNPLDIFLNGRIDNILRRAVIDRKSTRLNSSHVKNSY